jgi:hypothetical protein
LEQAPGGAMIALLKEILYALILICPAIAFPITVSKDMKAPDRLIVFLWAVMILGMVFGIPGKACALLLLNVIDLPSLPDKQQLFGLGIISSWGTTYPLFWILHRRLAAFKENSCIPNITSMFIYFYSLHLCFAALGIFLLKTFG